MLRMSFVLKLVDYTWSSDLLQSSSDYYQKLKSTVIQNVSKNLQFKNLKSLHVACYFRQVYVYKKRHSQFIGYTLLKKGLFICFLALNTNYNIYFMILYFIICKSFNTFSFIINSSMYSSVECLVT